jgi:phosphoribosylaminoimidazolecarboxamide formyltransferase / IMP cyclohydrolase
VRLRYGMNPHQAATATPLDATSVPVRVLNGEPSSINILDALSAWRLVREAATALGRAAAASFKHVSPAGAAVAGGIDAVMAETYGLDQATVGELTSAYVRARDTDPKSSYGDFIAVSEPVDAELADLLLRLVSDGIVAPDYAPGVVARLSRKKQGRFLVLRADPAYQPPAEEVREVFGMRLAQRRDDAPLTAQHLAHPVCGALPPRAVDDLLLGLITVRYTQSNSVAYTRDGMTLGVGAGQQSRVDCTRLAGAKAHTWWLRRHPTVRAAHDPADAKIQDRVNRQISYLDGDLIQPPPLTRAERQDWLGRLDHVSMASDGALPFRDNVDHARRHGVRYIAEPGGAARAGDVLAACLEHDIALAHTGIRLFQH